MIDRYMDRVDLPPKFVIPGGRPLSAALDVARAAIRRAERRVVALARAEEISARGRALPEPRLRRRLRDGPLRRHRRPGAVRRARRLEGRRLMAIRATARRREGYLHDVEVDGHSLVVDEPADGRRHRRRPLPDPPGGGRAGLVHRDHRRDVRGAQGVGAGDVEVDVDMESTDLGLTLVHGEPEGRVRPRRRPARAAARDRRQVPGPPDARQRDAGLDRGPDRARVMPGRR